MGYLSLLPEIWYDPIPSLHLVLPEFLLGPGLGVVCCYTQIPTYEDEACEQSFIHELTLWSCKDS